MATTKNLHSELTRRVLSDPNAREAFIRSIRGNPNEIIPIGNKKYRLVPSRLAARVRVAKQGHKSR